MVLADVTRRDAKKMDRFSLLALATARLALGGVGEAQRRRCGFLCGNTTAGWTFTEPQLDLLHARGTGEVSPYLASAWFPAAPQGQVSILLGLCGYAKTLATDRCAGAQAIGLAYRRVAQGRLELALAGAAEAPVSPFVEAAMRQAGRRTDHLAEGAAFLLLGPVRGRPDGGAAGLVTIDGHLMAARPATAGALVARLAAFVERRLGEGAVLPVACSVACDESDEGLAATALAEAAPGSLGAVAFPGHSYGETFSASSAIAAAAAMRRVASHGGSELVLTLGRHGVDALWLSRTSK
jgi:hypothetical protein